MDWLPPTAALVGVVVGGFLNAALGAAEERRRDRAAAAVAARMVSDELLLIKDTIASSMRDGRWGAILDPGLPYARGLWAVEHRQGGRPESAWSTSAAPLAKTLTAEEWNRVCTPYALVDRLGLQFWTDQPDRDLTDDVQAALAAIADSVQPAVSALKRVAIYRKR